MKVILLQELKGKGGEGDVVEVTRGHAVNFLFPRKIAIEATKGNLKQLELRKHNIAKREAERLDTADKIFAALNEKVVTVRARVGEEGQLFGSITAPQIAEALLEQYGAEVDRRKIDIRSAIKTAGEHTVSIAVYREIKAVVTVNVIDERTPEEVAADAAADVDGANPELVAELAAEVANAEAGIDTVTEVAAEAADEVVAEIAEAADEAADEVVEAVAEATEEAVEAVEDAVSEKADAVDEAVEAVAEAVDEAVDEAVAEATEDAVEKADE